MLTNDLRFPMVFNPVVFSIIFQHVPKSWENHTVAIDQQATHKTHVLGSSLKMLWMFRSPGSASDRSWLQSHEPWTIPAEDGDLKMGRICHGMMRINML